MGSLGLAAALALFGTGTAVRSLLGGRLADRSVQAAIYLALGTLAVVLALFPITLHNKSAALATIGALGLASGLVIAVAHDRSMHEHQDSQHSRVG